MSMTLTLAAARTAAGRQVELHGICSRSRMSTSVTLCFKAFVGRICLGRKITIGLAKLFTCFSHNMALVALSRL